MTLNILLRSTARIGFIHARHWAGHSNSAQKYSFVFVNDNRRRFSQYSNPWLQSLYESPPVVMAEQILTQFHALSGFSWWSSIVISTIGLRVLATFPLAVYSEVVLARLANLGLSLSEEEFWLAVCIVTGSVISTFPEPEANEINKVLQEDIILAKHRFNLSENQAMKLYKSNMNKQVRLLIERENCHPMKARLLVLIQIPLWVGLSCSLRDMAFRATLGDFEYWTMKNEGFLWISNLTAPDTSLIFPIATALLNLTNVELYNLKSNLPKSRFVEIVNNVSRLLCLVVIPASFIMPSSVSLYWFCSALAATCQHLILISPRFRRFARIPITPKELVNPYATIWINFKRKFLKETS